MSSEKTSVFKRFLQNKDRNAIVICVFIAFVFWLTNALSEDYTHDYEFEMEYRLQDNVSFASVPRQTVEARLSGQGWELFKASVKRGFRHVPLTVVSPEVTRTDLISALYEHLTDYDVTVREVNADVINLDINMVITRSVPISFTQKAICADGFVFTDTLHPEPLLINVTGPSSLIERLAPITVEDVEIPPLAEDYNQTVNLNIPAFKYLSIQPTSVQLVASVERLVQVTLSKELLVENSDSEFILSNSTVNITYRVAESVESAISSDSITASINTEEMPLDSGTVRVRLHDVPSLIDDISVTPSEITYRRIVKD